MEVISGTPPNFADIVAVFPAAKRMGTIFTYGNTVYINGGGKLTEPLRYHESVHSRRQLTMTDVNGHAIGPATWWEKYLSDKEFRLREELIAHAVEYKCYLAMCGRNQRRIALKTISSRLSSPLYGNMVSQKRAVQLLSEAA